MQKRGRQETPRPAGSGKSKPSEAKRQKAAAAGQYEWITEDLRPLAEPLENFKPDPDNARKHDERNISAIAASLRQFGQLKPIVVNRDTQIIEAGNGAYRAAAQLGWTHLAVVWVTHDPDSAVGFSVADNRSAELATWDDVLLAELIGQIEDSTPDLATDLMLHELRQQAEADSDGEDEDDASTQLDDLEYRIVITCQGEEHQARLLERFEKEDLQCRALIS